MFASERIRKIKELLIEYKEVDINTLRSVLSTSGSTIRRDLDKLEEEGFLKRHHGGAVLVEENPVFMSKEAVDEVKADVQSVADLAIEMINSDEQIFLGGGRICQAIAANLSKDWSGTIVTNSLDVAYELTENRNIRTILLGGLLMCENGQSVTEGEEVLAELNKYVFHKAFVTVTGITIEHGYFLNTRLQTELYHHLKKNAMELIAVITEDKFDKIGLIKLADKTYFSKIVSNVNVPDEYKKSFFNNNITLYTSFNDL